MLKRLAPDLGVQPGTQARNVISNFEVSMTGGSGCIEQRGQPEKTVCAEAQLPVVLKQQIGTAFALARHKYAWLLAAAFAKAGRGLLIAGDMGDPNDSIRWGLETNGWELLDSELLAIRVEDLMIVPLGARARPEQAAAKMGRVATPFESLVVTKRAPLHARDVSIFPLSPAAAVASLIGKSLDFRIERDRAVNLLCRLVERRPAAQVHFSRPHEAARVISRWADALPEAVA